MLFTILKIAIGIGCIIALIHFDFIDFSLLANALSAPGVVLFAFTCLLFTVFIGALRWQILMRALHTEIGYLQSLNFTFIGQFFNVFLPGAYGGDFVRGGLAYRLHKDKLGAIMMSSLVDRLTGLVGLLVISLAVLALIPSQFQFWIGLIVVTSLALAFCCLFAAVKFKRLFIAIIRLMPGPLERILMRIFETVVGALERYWNRKMDLVAAIALSVFQYVLVLESLHLLGGAMDITGLSWIGYIVSGVAGLFANAIPISPGGLGIGEAAFGQVAHLLEDQTTNTAYSSVFLLMRTLTLLTAVFGVIPFLLYRDTVNAVTREKDKLHQGGA
ncbi:lysylphosphatidylglycerol synthase transmembrane domain-containing protein [Sneathiella sp. HT1-7]|uniref:lysylphosphatidylglycerol synthase transmembrane domain-containing protein n=1 Tax=Sneathiella sp. HT1-7 TaxID=2887192 RepID=UPI001D15498C|nr:lysylphosphatidylglycerol synthase transmembrane domain-containing protein [Sneathiella sp. HT1-7]MCC3305337.1 flippase-like domain-containing protein [Sneathiella sp. HT1-7]